MRTTLACALALAFTLAPHAVPAQQPDMRLHAYGSVAISPDGTRVVSLENLADDPAAKGVPNPAIVIRASADGRVVGRIDCPHEVACRLSAPVWSPDGTRLAYLLRNVKMGSFAVWYANADGSAARPWLASFSGLLNAPRWSPDGRQLAVLATLNAHKEIGATQAGAALTGEISATLAADVQRIAILDARGALRFASPADLFVYEYDWTPDGRGFAATGAHGNGDDSWWVARLYAISAVSASPSAREILQPATQLDAPRVSPDGRRVAFIGGLMSDFGSVGGDVYVVPFGGGAASDVTPGLAATATSLSWNGRDDHITFTALQGDRSVIDSVDLASGTIRTLWSAPVTTTADATMRVSFARDGVTSAAVVQDFEHAPEIVAGTLGSWVSLTHENAAIAPAVRARSVAWTDDGLHVQGWLLEPRALKPGATYPLIVLVHGGPSAAAQPSFVGRGTVRELVDHGYFVFEPNPRGSYGQGERFASANVKDFGGGDLRDILAGVDAVERVAPVDDKRLGIYGHSYGGYMTMWAVTQTHRFKAAVAGAGVADWLSYYGENGIDQWMIPFFGASVYDDPAVYAKSAPMTFIKNVRTPTFVYVGERDVECPAPQSFEFWHALETLGVPTSLVVYAGEGHGIRDPAHMRDLSQRTLAWFDRYVR